AFLEEARAGFRERHGACGAVKERVLDEALELFDPGRDDRGRHAQLACRVDEALALRDLHEGLNAQESVHECLRSVAAKLEGIGNRSICNSRIIEEVRLARLAVQTKRFGSPMRGC